MSSTEENTQSQSPGHETNDQSGTRCIWTDADDAILVRVLKSQKANGASSDNGWKSTVWVTVARALKEEGTGKGAKTASKCNDHWQNVSHLTIVLLM
jgi:hypothetical protein